VLENICQHVLAFSSNFFGAITHRGGRDARVPVLRRFAAILSATPTGDGLEYQHVFHPFGDEGKPRPYNVSVFWFGAIEISGVFWRSSCRLAPTLFTKKARRSVTHLTSPMRFPPHCFRLAPLAENVTARRSVTHLTFWFCWCVLAIQLSACADVIHQESPAVGYPPYVCRHVLAFSSNFFGAITHRGGRDARVPVRRRFAANLCGITRALPYAMIFCSFRALMLRIDTVYR
jgi:hypothetical protein